MEKKNYCYWTKGKEKLLIVEKSIDGLEPIENYDNHEIRKQLSQEGELWLSLCYTVPKWKFSNEKPNSYKLCFYKKHFHFFIVAV